MPLPMMKCSFSRLEVGRSSSMLLPCTVDSPSCSLLVTWATGRGQGLTQAGGSEGPCLPPESTHFPREQNPGSGQQSWLHGRTLSPVQPHPVQNRCWINDGPTRQRALPWWHPLWG